MPSFPKPSAELTALFEAALPDDPRIVKKKVFGSPSAVVEGNMFAGVRGTRVLLRLPEAEMPALLALPGAEPFQPMPGMTMQNFALLPETLHTDAEALRGWLARAYVGALALPAKKAKPRRGG
jgi:TfoX/Sxy family transcriptional regulator of competence genes